MCVPGNADRRAGSGLRKRVVEFVTMRAEAPKKLYRGIAVIGVKSLGGGYYNHKPSPEGYVGLSCASYGDLRNYLLKVRACDRFSETGPQGSVSSSFIR